MNKGVVINKVAIIIVNYNMPERTDALATHINKYVKWPHDLIVVDNGSDISRQSEYTTLALQTNVQTTNGWLMGLAYADALAKMDYEYFAYWFLITSAAFVSTDDVLTPMAVKLIRDDSAVGIHPALTDDSTTMWTHLKSHGSGLRQTHMIDNIASLYRADWFDSVGRFDPELIYAHGIDLETCYKARQQDKTLWVHDDLRIEKITNIGYTMARMNMSAQQRAINAQLNMDNVLIPRYGPNYWNILLEGR